jgi:hypothetical protein
MSFDSSGYCLLVRCCFVVRWCASVRALNQAPHPALHQRVRDGLWRRPTSLRWPVRAGIHCRHSLACFKHDRIIGSEDSGPFSTTFH